VALVAFLVATVALLAFRGYGAWLTVRPTETSRPALVDLNSAGEAELEQVPGIGPGLAKRIKDDREAKGPFRSVEELRRVRGIGPLTFDKVAAYLHVDPASVPETDRLEPLVLERKPRAPDVTPTYSRSTQKIQPGEPPINVNTASIEELMRLPAVGPVTAKNIAAARDAKPFRTLADLDAVPGIGPKKLEQIGQFVVFE
jgi:competence protein ComEA